MAMAKPHPNQSVDHTRASEVSGDPFPSSPYGSAMHPLPSSLSDQRMYVSDQACTLYQPETNWLASIRRQIVLPRPLPRQNADSTQD